MKQVIVLGLVLCIAVLFPCFAGNSAKVTLPDQQLPKIDADSPGPPVPHLRNSGGPDTFGYTWIDSEDAGGPSYSWVDITATGTEIAASDMLDDDDRCGPYPIGFLFNFYGAGMEEFWVESNGAIGFVANVLPLSNYQLPYTWYGGMIALFWDDLDSENGQYGSVYYDTVTIGQQEACVVTFDDYSEHPPDDQSPRITMQVLMFDDGRIRIQYQSIDNGFDCTSCTVGIQSNDGSDGLTCIYNDVSGNYPYAQYVIDFIPPDPTASLSGIVYDGVGGTISGVNVRCGCGQAVSDANGNYTINGLYPGTCKYIVWKSGYDAINSTTTLAAGGNVLHASLALSPLPVSGVFSDDFEGGGIPLFTGSGDWQFGTPTLDPNGAHSGSNAWSTILAGNYGISRDDWLISQKGFVVQSNYSLKYFHWFDYEGGYDGYNVWVSTTAGAFWSLLQPTGGYSDEDAYYTVTGYPCFNNWNTNEERSWVQKEFPLGDYVGQTVWFAFRHTTDGSVNYSGVTIDDLSYNASGVTPTVTLQLWPVNVNIPSYGGTVVYDAGITSTFNQVISGQAWTDLILPSGMPYGPLMMRPVNVVPGYVFIGNLMQNIPAFAPPGPYIFNGYLGLYPNYVATTDNFPFTKTIVPSPDGTMVDNWEAEAWELAGVDPGETYDVNVPDGFELRPVVPNPFNSTATVTVDLPLAGRLTVTVYNVSGQQVAVLAEGPCAAGLHEFTLDGSALASGVYFVRAVAGPHEALRKITLLK